MNSVSKFLVRSVSAAALVAVAGGANAASYDVTATIGTQAASWSDVLTFLKFDSSLGTLTGVDIALDSTVSSSGGVDNEEATKFIGASIDAKATFSLTSGIDATSIDDNLTGVKVVAGASGTLQADNDAASNYTGTDDIAYTNATGAYSAFTSVDTAYLSSFVGTGLDTLSFDLVVSGGSIISAPLNGASFIATTANANLVVTYYYTPASAVPEPEGYALMLAGLAAVGAMSRRRRVG